jgi:hypothetical protein
MEELWTLVWVNDKIVRQSYPEVTDRLHHDNYYTMNVLYYEEP